MSCFSCCIVQKDALNIPYHYWSNSLKFQLLYYVKKHKKAHITPLGTNTVYYKDALKECNV